LLELFVKNRAPKSRKNLYLKNRNLKIGIIAGVALIGTIPYIVYPSFVVDPPLFI